MKSDIFISYSRRDTDFAHRLADALLDRKITVWIDSKNLSTGEKWGKSLEKAIKASKCVVVILSPDSVESDYVRSEIGIAHANKKPIFPVKIKQCELPLLLNSIQFCDFQDSFDDGLSALLYSLRSIGLKVEKKIQVQEQRKISIDVSDILVFKHPIDLRLVRIPDKRDFFIGKYPITNIQYYEFLKQTNHAYFRSWKGNLQRIFHLLLRKHHPVVGVSYYDAIAFCEWLSQETEKDFRLPNASEWEKAAKGNSNWKYPWGNVWIKSRCNNIDEKINDTSRVGKYSPRGDSQYGVSDMAGNVFEWISANASEANLPVQTMLGSKWHLNPIYIPQNNQTDNPKLEYNFGFSDFPQTPPTAEIMGGSFSSHQEECDCYARRLIDKDTFATNLGFRVVHGEKSIPKGKEEKPKKHPGGPGYAP